MMDCQEFDKHIHDYFIDPDFDWWLKRKMNAHYLDCDKCFNTFRVTKLLADKGIMADVASEMVKELVEQAELYQKQGKIPEAIKCLEEALELKPEDAALKARIAIHYKTSGRPVEDIPNEYIDSIVQVLVDTSIKKVIEEDYEEVLSLLNSALEFKPDDEELLIKMANAFTMAKRFDDALKVYDDLYKKDPLNVKYMLGMAFCVSIIKGIEEATSLAEEAMKLEPDNPDVLYDVGNYYQMSGRLEEAQSCLEKAFSLFPSPDIMGGLGSLYLEIGENENALRLLKDANLLDSDNTVKKNNLAVAKINFGKINEALELLRDNEENIENIDKDFSKHPEKRLIEAKATLFNNLAMCYYYIGNIDLAKKYIEAAFQFDSISETISHNREVILGNMEGKLIPMYLQ